MPDCADRFADNAGTQVPGVLHARARRSRDQAGTHRRSVYSAAATYVFAAFTAGAARQPASAGSYTRPPGS